MKNTIMALMLLFSFTIASALTVFTERTAHNCSYTGEDTDRCTASEAYRNVIVLRCRSGKTSCYYDSPTLTPFDD
jgi:hypothetical protein|tara:strand:+ start:358 stop:582 length:225 start_codon:yes stop_codon:yes gene_type:complete